MYGRYLNISAGNEAARLAGNKNGGLGRGVPGKLGVQLFKLLHQLLAQRIHLPHTTKIISKLKPEYMDSVS